MNMVALIEKKKHGDALDNAEIEYIVRGAADGTIPDYQLAAFLMAVCFTGMSDEETAQFTACMAHSLPGCPPQAREMLEFLKNL